MKFACGPIGCGNQNFLGESCSAQLERLDAEFLEPTENEIERCISGASKTRIPLNDAARLAAVVSEFGDEALRSIRGLQTDIGTHTDIANKVIPMFQRDNEMRNIVLTDAAARDKATRQFFNRALREVWVASSDA